MEWSVCRDGGLTVERVKEVLELWRQMEGNVSEQQVWREVGEKEGGDHGVFVKGNRLREVVGDKLLEKVYRSGVQHMEGGKHSFGVLDFVQ